MYHENINSNFYKQANVIGMKKLKPYKTMYCNLTPKIIGVSLLYLAVSAGACKKKPKPTNPDVLAEKPVLISFSFETSKNSQLTENVQGVLQAQNVLLELPTGVSLKKLVASATFSPGASISPSLSQGYDFTAPKDFTLTLKGEKSVYTVTAKNKPGYLQGLSLKDCGDCVIKHNDSEQIAFENMPSKAKFVGLLPAGVEDWQAENVLVQLRDAENHHATVQELQNPRKKMEALKTFLITVFNSENVELASYQLAIYTKDKEPVQIAMTRFYFDPIHNVGLTELVEGQIEEDKKVYVDFPLNFDLTSLVASAAYTNGAIPSLDLNEAHDFSSDVNLTFTLDGQEETYTIIASNKLGYLQDIKFDNCADCELKHNDQTNIAFVTIQRGERFTLYLSENVADLSTNDVLVTLTDADAQLEVVEEPKQRAQIQVKTFRINVKDDAGKELAHYFIDVMADVVQVQEVGTLTAGYYVLDGTIDDAKNANLQVSIYEKLAEFITNRKAYTETSKQQMPNNEFREWEDLATAGYVSGDGKTQTYTLNDPLAVRMHPKRWNSPRLGAALPIIGSNTIYNYQSVTASGSSGSGEVNGSNFVSANSLLNKIENTPFGSAVQIRSFFKVLETNIWITVIKTNVDIPGQLSNGQPKTDIVTSAMKTGFVDTEILKFSKEPYTIFTARPDSVVFYVQYAPQNGDKAVFELLLHDNQTGVESSRLPAVYGDAPKYKPVSENAIGYTRAKLSGTHSDWIRISMPIFYKDATTKPSYALLNITAGDGYNYKKDSKLSIDKIEFIYNN